MTPAQWLAKVRRLCLSLPGSIEKQSWGHPNFAAGCIYAAVERYRGRPSLCVLGTKEEQAILVQDERLFVPPYVGGKGWVGIWLDRAPPWPMVESLLRAAHALAVAKPRRKPAARRQGAKRRSARAR